MNPVEHMPAALAPTLQVAVPLWIDRLRRHTADQLCAVGHRCATAIGSEGDNVMFRASKPGATARAFNSLAEGLAVLAYAPGGVDFAGMHWEVHDSPLHPDDIADQRVDLHRLNALIGGAVTTVATAGGVL